MSESRETPVYTALSKSGVLGMTAETIPDDAAGMLQALGQILAGARPLTKALARDHAIRHLRDIGYAEPGRVLEAAIGRFDIRQPPVSGDSDESFPTLAELLTDRELTAGPRWLWHEYLAKGELVAVYGPSKVGKTSFLAALAAAITRGDRFLDRPAWRGGVLWADYENHYRRTVAKLAAADPDPGLLVVPRRGPPVEALRRYVLEQGPIGMLVVDSLLAFTGIPDENDSAAMRAATEPLRALAHETDTLTVVVHHARKSPGDHGDDMRGASSLRDIVDAYIRFGRVAPGDAEGDEARRSLTYEGRNAEPPHHLHVRRESEGCYSTVKPPAVARRDAILAALADGPATADQLADRGIGARQVIHGDLALLVDARSVHRSGSGRKGAPFVFALRQDDNGDSSASYEYRVGRMTNPAGEAA